MTNHRLQTSEEISPLAKRKRVIAAVAQDIVSNEDDDNVTDGMDICDIIDETHTLRQRESATANALHALGETIRNTLLEINEIREQNRERRHKELLEVLIKMTTHNTGYDRGKDEMVKTETINTAANNTKKHYLKSTNEQTNNACKYEDKISQKKTSNANELLLETKSSTTVAPTENVKQNDLNKLHENSTSIIERMSIKSPNVSSAHIQVTTKNSLKASPIIVGKEQVGKIKGIFAVKQNSKEELQKMRAQMIELQRKKMEDRERKKKEMQQRLQNNS